MSSSPRFHGARDVYAGSVAQLTDETMGHRIDSKLEALIALIERGSPHVRMIRQFCRLSGALAAGD